MAMYPFLNLIGEGFRDSVFDMSGIWYKSGIWYDGRIIEDINNRLREAAKKFLH